jgi:hypothetical protein
MRRPLTPIIVNLYVGPVGPLVEGVSWKEAWEQHLAELDWNADLCRWLAKRARRQRERDLSEQPKPDPTPNLNEFLKDFES